MITRIEGKLIKRKDKPLARVLSLGAGVQSSTMALMAHEGLFEQKPDFYSDLDPTSPSDEYNDDMEGMLIFRRTVYDQHTIMGLITEKSMDDDDDARGLSSFFGSNPVVSVLLLLILISISIGAGYLISASRVDDPKLLNEEDEEIIQAELLD